jgi:hypothetical protein
VAALSAAQPPGGLAGEEECPLTDQLHPMTPHHLPFYIVKPGETDVLMIVMGIFLIFAVHSLPEQMAHKSQKLQFEVVAVLGLIALFTHQHIFWIAGLLLALIDLPDFSTPLSRIAGSVEKIADTEDVAAETRAGELNEVQTSVAGSKQQPIVPAKQVGSHV